MKALVASRWFALADLGCAFLSGAIWYSGSQAGLRLNSPEALLKTGWPLLIALLPWSIRLAAGRPAFKRTIFDIPLAIFLLTAGVGLWVTYNREAGWAKFWVILAGILLYYALAGQPEQNLWLVAGMACLLGAVLGSVFLLGQDFQQQPADLIFLERMRQAWVSIRPSIPIPLGHLTSNFVGGILAILAPFSVAVLWYGWRGRRGWMILIALLPAALIALGLLMSSSRGAWMALAVALLAWTIWELSRRAARGKQQLHYLRAAWFLAVLVIIVPVAGLLLAHPAKFAELVDRLPGLASGSSRLDLARSGLYLIRDFPLTGGGLAAFPGLYSQYIKAIPFFLYGYSHNFYLDVALEQGMFAFLVLLAIFCGSALLLIAQQVAAPRENTSGWLCSAALAALTVLLIHGLIDDALYGEAGTPLVFFLPGMAVALDRALRAAPISIQLISETSIQKERIIVTGAYSRIDTKRIILLTVTALAALFTVCLLIRGWKPAVAVWHANLGAVQMARVELADFPTGRWDVERTQKNLSSSAMQLAITSFERSLRLNPSQATSQYRLGLIAIEKGEFASAIPYLNGALQRSPGHHGIEKALGYSYVWAGRPDLALPLLLHLPETQNEMEIYAWWWKENGREDLAIRSAQAATLLSNADYSLKK